MKLNYKKILPHVALFVGALLLVGAFFALVRMEEANTRDTVRMQQVIGIKQDLHRYYLNHAAYPAAFAVPRGYEYIPVEQGERYEIRFTLETNLFAKKGMYVLTPDSMR